MAKTKPCWPKVTGPLAQYADGFRAELARLGYTPLTAAGQLLARHASYLATERGLAQVTVALNVHLVRPFLLQREQQRDGRLDLDQLTAAEVRVFVVAQSRQRPRSVKRFVSALRSLLGFLHVEGIIGAPLAGAVPSPAGWTLTGLPEALEAGQVAAMLASCDLGTATGRRDRAILLLPARLGLRAGEV